MFKNKVVSDNTMIQYYSNLLKKNNDLLETGNIKCNKKDINFYEKNKEFQSVIKNKTNTVVEYKGNKKSRSFCKKKNVFIKKNVSLIKTDEFCGNEENIKDYCPGGYHPCYVGETLNNKQYTLIKKIGWGHFSTVWLAKDSLKNTYIALKVVRSATSYAKTASNEISLLKKMNKNTNHVGYQHVVNLIEFFFHNGPNGHHTVMVFDYLGENLLSLITRFKVKGIPLFFVKKIAKQLLLGLDYLHTQCGIIHTDLKPENVLIDFSKTLTKKNNISMTNEKILEILKEHIMTKKNNFFSESSINKSTRSFQNYNSLNLSDIDINNMFHHDKKGLFLSPRKTSNQLVKKMEVFINFENSMNNNSNTVNQDSNSDSNFLNNLINLYLQYQSNESINTFNFDDSICDLFFLINNIDNFSVKIADLGNSCLIDNVMNYDIQTRQYRAPEVILGLKWNASVDIWSFACLIFELLTTDYLFNPKSGKNYTDDDDHIAQIIELLGFFPKSLIINGQYSKNIFDSNGNLLRIQNLRYWSLKDVLIEKYMFVKSKASAITDFLYPLLSIHPDLRLDAKSQLNHEWFLFNNN